MIAEKLNKFFLSVFTTGNIKQKHVPELMFSGNENIELRPIAVTREEVLEFTNKLQTNKLSGPDGISLEALK